MRSDDLVGKIAAATTLTRKTVAAILKGMMAARFEQFAWNPEKFISECIRIIKEQMGSILVECIEYKQLEDTFDSNILAADKRAGSTARINWIVGYGVSGSANIVVTPDHVEFGSAPKDGIK